MDAQERYAIVETSGTQLRVSEGDEIDLFHVDAPEGSSLTFDRILLVKNEGRVMVGRPIVDGAQVKATVMKHHRGDKIRVATYKAKSRTRRVKGYRDELTRVKIMNIVPGKK